jgi:hypothetical protein
MTLSRDKGGLGVNNIKDIYQAQQVNGLLLTLNGPKCPAKSSVTEEFETVMDTTRQVPRKLTASRCD